MNKPALYKLANDMQRRDVRHTIDEYSHVLRWREEGGDSILDIGSGSGDNLIDFLLPILPPNFQRLVGADVSHEMVEFARQHYTQPKVTFEVFDVGIPIEQQSFDNTEPFDHITSFYCLHWVQDQECAARNVYKLLKPGGDMLLAFLAKNPVYDIYKLMSQSEKWATFMTDVDQFISPYHFSEDPVAKFDSLLSSVGFSKRNVELHKISYVFEGYNTLISIDHSFLHIYLHAPGFTANVSFLDAHKAVNPFLDRIPAHDHDAFYVDYINHVVNMNLALDEVQPNCETCRFLSTYEYFIAHAIK